MSFSRARHVRSPSSFLPTIGGSASSSVTVTGDGLSVSTSLIGNGLAPNVPTPGSLTIAPAAANYGTNTVGTSVPPRNFVVTNPGQTAVPLTGVGLSGGGADQFVITSNTCAGSLVGGGTCIIAVGATVTRVGTLSATLGVLGSGGQSAQAALRIAGRNAVVVPETFNPVLKMSPAVVSPGEVTTAVGSAFPPNIDVALVFAGEFPFATVHTDAAGEFRFDVLMLRNGIRIGGREVVALDQPQFSGVRAPLLIDLATYRPSGINPALTGGGLISLVSRSG